MSRAVVHVLGSLDRGGAEMTSLELCRRISPLDVRQTFVCLSGRTGTQAHAFEAAGAQVLALPLFPLLPFTVRWVRFVRASRPDAVVSHVSLPSGYVLALARIGGVRVRIARFHSEHDGRPNSTARRVLRGVLRVLLRAGATQIYGVTTAAAEFAAGRSAALARKSAILPNGVALDRFHPGAGTPSGSPMILHVGRASQEKNRRALVDIAAQLPPDFRVVIAGPGGSDDLQLGGADPAVRARIELVGDTDDVPRLMAQASVLVLPSLREGLPGVVLEALAAGTPVVASDTAGLRALARELDGIQIVALSQGPVAWATAVLHAAAASSDERAAIRRSIEQSPYALDRVVGRWRAVFEGTA